jgi:hypothetical protein
MQSFTILYFTSTCDIFAQLFSIQFLLLSVINCKFVICRPALYHKSIKEDCKWSSIQFWSSYRECIIPGVGCSGSHSIRNWVEQATILNELMITCLEYLFQNRVLSVDPLAGHFTALFIMACPSNTEHSVIICCSKMHLNLTCRKCCDKKNKLCFTFCNAYNYH